jgi:hypothetical protein
MYTYIYICIHICIYIHTYIFKIGILGAGIGLSLALPPKEESKEVI